MEGLGSGGRQGGGGGEGGEGGGGGQDGGWESESEGEKERDSEILGERKPRRRATKMNDGNAATASAQYCAAIHSIVVHWDALW